VGRERGHRGAEDDGEGGRGPHPPENAELIHLQPRRRVCGSHPLEQMTPRDDQANQGSTNRVQHHERLMRQKRAGQEDLIQAGLQVLPFGADVISEPDALHPV
jgi:hypothetical protein